MRSHGQTLACIFACALSFTAHAECQDIKTTQAIVKYVCDYSLVSHTQCALWTEDVRQMQSNSAVIVNSFISWNNNQPEPVNQATENH